MQDKVNVCYLRLSKEDGDVTEGTAQESCSIASQRQCIQQYLTQHPELGTNFLELVDDGFSGTNFNRPGITKLLKMVETGQVSTIIVRDLSRFARNYLEAGRYLELIFPIHKVRFLSILDKFDTERLGESTAGFQLAVKNLINQLYSRDISRKIKSSVDLKKRSGAYVYGAAPYGYQKGSQKNTITVDPPAAEVVRRIFSLAANGTTVSQIASRLNAEKIPTPSMYLKKIRGAYRIRPYWTHESVKNILRKQIYTGDTVLFQSQVKAVGSKQVRRIPVDQQEILPGTHEPIVSHSLYKQAQTVINSTKKSKQQTPGSILTPYLACGCCGNKLQKGRASNQQFRCATARYVQDTGCESVQIQEDLLKRLLLHAIQAQLKLSSTPNCGTRAVQTASTAQEIEACQRTIAHCQAELLQQYEAYIAGRHTREYFLQAKSRIRVLMDRAAEALKGLESEHQAAKEHTPAERIVPCSPDYPIESLTPDILHLLIRKIWVFPNQMVQIEWNFHDSMI